MASREEIAKANYTQGAELAWSAAEQADEIGEWLTSMRGLLTQIQSLCTNANIGIETIEATATVAREFTNDANGVLEETFPTENERNPHIKEAIEKGSQAAHRLTPGRRVGFMPPLDLETLRQRMAKISEHITPLLGEIDSAFNDSYWLGLHLTSTAASGGQAVEAIGEYQQQDDLDQ